ncbi:MAG: type II toxin-antitoxin system HicB family antitoxin [Gemmataceae bacterium]|nr:type II toxin-antitoxin system HicB family antitoxin [Gemmataceae bacterium]
MSYYKLPLVFEPQPEGGYTVTCPVLPELLTEGDTLEEARANVADALVAVMEIYEESGRPLPSSLRAIPLDEPLWTESLVQLP